MVKRLEFCLNHLDMDNRRFVDMMDVIHLDEEWFYLTQNKRKFYLGVDEADPYRTTKSKRFSTKVMFLAALARPRWDTGRNCHLNGKISIWPFVKTEIAQRTKRNRPARVSVTKTIDSVTNVEYRQFLVEKVLPAIQEKWPRGTVIQNRKIRHQQDIARPHIPPSDPAFVEATERIGLNIDLS